MRTNKFKVILTSIYSIFIPNKIFTPFAEQKKSRVKVKIYFDDKELEFYAAVKKDKKTGDFKMMFSKQKQKELGLSLSDEFEIQLFEDTSKYGVEIPEELDAVFLSDYNAFKIFESLSAGKKRSIIYTIIRIKDSQKRIDKSLILTENLKRGIQNPKELFTL